MPPKSLSKRQRALTRHRLIVTLAYLFLPKRREESVAAEAVPSSSSFSKSSKPPHPQASLPILQQCVCMGGEMEYACFITPRTGPYSVPVTLQSLQCCMSRGVGIRHIKHYCCRFLLFQSRRQEGNHGNLWGWIVSLRHFRAPAVMPN